MAVRLRCLLVWLFIAPLASGAGVAHVTLGLVAPPTEPDATSLLHGAQLAVADANAAGFSQVDLAVQSTNGQWGTVGNDAVALAVDRSVDAIVAPADGAACHLILQVSGRTQVPVACVCSDSSVTETGVTWAVRVVPRTDQAVEAIMAATRQSNGSPLSWCAVVPEGRPGRMVRRDLERAIRHANARMVSIIETGEPKQDAVALTRAIVSAKPGGVLIWLPPSDAGSLAAALRTAGYAGRLAGPGPLDSPEFLAAAGPAANGTLVAEFSLDADHRARAEQFGMRYRSRFGCAPDFSAAAAYDAAGLLIQLLRQAGNGDSLSQFPVSVAADGVTGVMDFDKLGNRTDALAVLTCQDGRFVPFSTNPP